MSKSFSAFKKESRSQIDTLVKQLETAAGKTGADFNDDRFWSPTRDKSGKAFAVIRFMPVGPNDQTPYAKVYSHGFKGPKGQWFIEECPTTLGRPCPVCEANSELWNTEDKEKRLIVSGQGRDRPGRKRKLGYIFNVFVVSDPSNREAEGKTWLYKGGKKVMDKIMGKMKPEFEGDKAINVFDFWEGANFKLAIKMVEGFPNYESSEFVESTKLLDGDDTKLEELWNGLHKLSDFTDASKYKSYEDLKAKFNKVVGGHVTVPATAEQAEKEEKKVSAPSIPAEEPDEDDATLAMFRQMAADAE